MKNKGFTLIELLAVIAILAIILLIAVPMTLGTIASARDNTLKNSAQSLWDTAEKCISMNQIETTNCAVPALFATVDGAGYRSAGLTGQTNAVGDTGELIGSNWRLLSNTNYSGKYLITFAASSTTITSVVASSANAAAGAMSGRRCTITTRSGACTYAN